MYIQRGIETKAGYLFVYQKSMMIFNTTFYFQKNVTKRDVITLKTIIDRAYEKGKEFSHEETSESIDKGQDVEPT